MGVIPWTGMGRGYWLGRYVACSSLPSWVARCPNFRRMFLRNCPTAFCGRGGHRAVGGRHDGSLLLALHASVRGAGYFCNSPDEAPHMNILAMLWSNLRRGAMTVRFPKRPAVSPGYRGLVCFNPELCTGCAICRFRCTARAINFSSAKNEFTWSYDPGQCTFCGRCVEGCKSHALSQAPECPPVYLRIGELKQIFTLSRKVPASKSRVAAPIAAAVQSGSSPEEGSQ